MRFKFVQMKIPAPFEGRYQCNSENTLKKLKENLLLQNQRANFSQTWYKAPMGEEDSDVIKCKATLFSKGRLY